MNTIYRGIPAAPGIAIGSVLQFDASALKIIRAHINKSDIEGEIQKLLKAVSQAKANVFKVKKEVEEKLGGEHAKIFDAHMLILDDSVIIDKAVEDIKVNQKNAGYAFDDTILDIIRKLQNVNDEYLRDRIVDVRDVRNRVLHILFGTHLYTLADLMNPCIVVSHELTPSDTAQMNKEMIMAVVTETGGKTSHAAILARALEIPSVIGLPKALHLLHSGATIIVDGNSGEVVVEPDKETIKKYQLEKRKFNNFEKRMLKFADRPARTKDGREINILANIELPFEIDTCKDHGARGVGLFRTEFLYLTRTDLPSEEEQTAVYEDLAKKVAPDPFVIRTFDLGGDKFVHGTDKQEEMNPFLGWRSIRISLDREDIFRVQLRAILRASTTKNIRIMFPMISGLEQLRQAKFILEEEKQKLIKRKIPCDEDIKVGTMIEVPAAALIAEHLAKECDFISVGTNDLVQYTIAVDRGNQKIAHLFEELHPSILAFISAIIEAGHNANIPVGVCGEMAADPAEFLILLGMGVDNFSMSPIIIPEMKKLLSSVAFEDVYYLVSKVMKLKTVHEIKKCIKDELKDTLGILPFYQEESLKDHYRPQTG